MKQKTGFLKGSLLVNLWQDCKNKFRKIKIAYIRSKK